MEGPLPPKRAEFCKQKQFPKQVYLCSSILEKNRVDTPLGALGLVGRGFGPAGRAGLGVGFGSAGRAG